VLEVVGQEPLAQDRRLKSVRMPTSRLLQSAVNTRLVSVEAPTVRLMGMLLVVSIGSSPDGGAR
jgi:hypothetical protein